MELKGLRVIRDRKDLRAIRDHKGLRAIKDQLVLKEFKDHKDRLERDYQQPLSELQQH